MSVVEAGHIKNTVGSNVISITSTDHASPVPLTRGRKFSSSSLWVVIGVVPVDVVPRERPLDPIPQAGVQPQHHHGRNSNDVSPHRIVITTQVVHKNKNRQPTRANISIK